MCLFAYTTAAMKVYEQAYASLGYAPIYIYLYILVSFFVFFKKAVRKKVEKEKSHFNTCMETSTNVNPATYLIFFFSTDEDFFEF